MEILKAVLTVALVAVLTYILLPPAAVILAVLITCGVLAGREVKRRRDPSSVRVAGR